MAISDSIGAGLSGALAAQQQFQNSANNTANRNSVSGPNPPAGTPASALPTETADGTSIFRPTDTRTESTGNGVSVTSTLRNPSSVQLFAPQAADAGADGTVFRGNVSEVGETVIRVQAQNQLEANLATIRTGDELLKSIIDLKA